jgi:hypothetical protein
MNRHGKLSPSPALRERVARAKPGPGEGDAIGEIHLGSRDARRGIAPSRETLTRLATLATLSRGAGEGQ